MTEKERLYTALLVCRCRRGEREAYVELVGIWERRLLYFIRRLVTDEQQAWQVLQETWLEMLRSLKKLKTPDRFPGWIYSIARHKALDLMRTEYRRCVREEVCTLRSSDIAVTDLEVREDAEAVHKGLSQIPVHQREVLTLFFLQDLSLTEIAETLQVPLGTIKSRIFLAKKALKAVLEKEGC